MAIKSAKKQDINDIIFLSDPHFGAKSASVEWLENMVDYFENFFFPLVRKEISEGYNPVIVVTGDYFDNRQHIDIDVMNKAMDIMEKMESLCGVYMMIGNHDIYKKKETDITSLRVFDKYKNVTVVPDTLALTIKGDHTFLLVSWVGDFAKENKMIAKYKDKYEYIVMHTEISGMTYDNNRPIINGVNLSPVDENCHIISGHIHKRQGNKKAMYLGSPYHLTKSDVGNEKGIYCFRVNDEGGISVNFTQNDYSPKFIKEDFSKYGKKPEAWADIVKNNYVEIVFEEEELNRFNVNEFADKLRRFEPKKIEFSCRRKQKIEDQEPRYTEESTIEDIFKDQVSEKGLTEEQNHNIIEMNNNYMKKAVEEMAQ